MVQCESVSPIALPMWADKLHVSNIQWNKVFELKLRKIKEQKLVAFSYKILNNILATPENLCKWKIIEHAMCSSCFCMGTLEHMLIECAYFEQYYKVVANIFKKMGLKNIKFNLYSLLCGYKAYDEMYLKVNEMLCIIYFVVYKT